MGSLSELLKLIGGLSISLKELFLRALPKASRDNQITQGCHIDDFRLDPLDSFSPHLFANFSDERQTKRH